MDTRVKEIYMLMLKKNARITHFLKYDDYYEIHFEWESDSQLPSNFITYFEDTLPRPWIETKLIAFERIRR